MKHLKKDTQDCGKKARAGRRIGKGENLRCNTLKKILKFKRTNSLKVHWQTPF